MAAALARFARRPGKVLVPGSTKQTKNAATVAAQEQAATAAWQRTMDAGAAELAAHPPTERQVRKAKSQPTP
jgi:hypothetical protein